MIAPGGVGTKSHDTSLTAAVLVAAGQNLKGDARPASRLCAGLTPLLASKACQQHFIICADARVLVPSCAVATFLRGLHYAVYGASSLLLCSCVAVPSRVSQRRPLHLLGLSTD